jgi:hypothetical protein
MRKSEHSLKLSIIIIMEKVIKKIIVKNRGMERTRIFRLGEEGKTKRKDSKLVYLSNLRNMPITKWRKFNDYS